MMPSAGYGDISGMPSQDSQNKKKFAIIGISSIVLVAVVAVAGVAVSRHNAASSSSAQPDGGLQSSKAVALICQPTDYKQECQNAIISAGAGNSTDPKQLMEVAFNATVGRITSALNHSSVLQAAAKDPRTSAALASCEEVLGYAIDDTRRSIEKFANIDITKLGTALDDLKTWLSAAITYQETCLDAFANTTGDAADSMKNALQTAGQLSSNALAMINNVQSLLSSFQLPSLSRRLLAVEDGFPTWVAARKRKLLAAATPAEAKPDATVAQDGSGNYNTIRDALLAVPKNSNTSFVIYVKAGVYNEKVQVDRAMTNVVMIGDGPTASRITGNLNFIDGTPTFKTATVSVTGDGFMAKNMGFENTAGAAKHQAVALRVESDRSVFYNCQMDGYQDTLYAHANRQFYRECTISGTIDFIFGDALSIFQNCLMLLRRPMPNQQNLVTAQGRKDRNEPTAIVIQNCTITAGPDYVPPFVTQMPSYLGRPWKPFSRTIYIQSQIDDVINPEGWFPWMGTIGLDTCFYAEFDNRGAGANTAQRVKWEGIKTLAFADVQPFTVEQYIQGDQWLNPTGVPYIPGLLPMNEDTRIH